MKEKKQLVIEMTSEEANKIISDLVSARMEYEGYRLDYSRHEHLQLPDYYFCGEKITESDCINKDDVIKYKDTKDFLDAVKEGKFHGVVKITNDMVAAHEEGERVFDFYNSSPRTALINVLQAIGIKVELW